jgi:hypothetical protein
MNPFSRYEKNKAIRNEAKANDVAQLLNAVVRNHDNDSDSDEITFMGESNASSNESRKRSLMQSTLQHMQLKFDGDKSYAALCLKEKGPVLQQQQQEPLQRQEPLQQPQEPLQQLQDRCLSLILSR